MYTLGIDYGASNIGIALVKNTDTENIPLVAGTVIIGNARWLKEKVETRASIRRIRRTRKTKKRRLQKLRDAFHSIKIEDSTVQQIVRFCKRRGYKSLFDEGLEQEENKESELTYRFTREEFFKCLEHELLRIVPDADKRSRAFAVCEKILNRQGDRFQEIRLIRFDNRGVSRCAWEGCDKVTPRRDNALREALSQQLYTVLQNKLRKDQSLRNCLDANIDELALIGTRLCNAAGDNVSAERKVLRKKARTILRDIRDRLYQPDTESLNPEKAWKYIETGLLNIMENSGGRNRYCREHSKTYVDTILSGKPAPFKKTISDADIISRREQIIYQKLWRYLESRVLPLAHNGIDRIVVERNAFDLLEGNRKKILKTSDAFIEEMYQQGPMYGFDSVGEMLTTEFGGLCAYCGNESNKLLDRDHILPRAHFFFDSYLNLVPACPKCNTILKGKRSLSEASMHIHEKAYEAYSQYLNKKFGTRPLHYLHTMKKGILNLMKDNERVWEAEQYLALIAKDYTSIVQTQRNPRPLARYLTSRLKKRQKQEPKIVFRSGRHAALYRNIAYPDFNKLEDKREGKTSNHAIDAILLASELPDPYPLEGRFLSPAAIKGWAASVRSKAPKECENGIPTLPFHESYVEGFEHVNENGYVETEMRATRWNQKDCSTHKQDPYGWCDKTKMPTKRVAALDLYNDLKAASSEKKLRDIIGRINHPSLKSKMLNNISVEAPGISAADALKSWLRTSVKNSIEHSVFSNHPGNQARKKDLMHFAEHDDADIPPVIGVKMHDTGTRNQIDLARIDKQTGKIGHYYKTYPVNRSVILAYPRKKSGEPDTNKPCVAYVKQNLSVKPEEVGLFKELPSTLEQGFIIGERNKVADGWHDAVKSYLSECGFHSYTILTPGCVLCYKDGRKLFLRNFKKGVNFNKSMLKNLSGICRTPMDNRITGFKYLT